MGYLPAILLILAPTYVFRFSLLGIPANFLMVAQPILVGVFFIWLYRTTKFQDFFYGLKRSSLVALSGFWVLAGALAIFPNGLSQEKLGHFIVIFLEPVVSFLIVRYIFQNIPKAKIIFNWTLFILLAVAGLYAIIQYYTLIGVPEKWWGNSIEPKRSLAFFSHPNGYALFSAPLLAFLIPQAFSLFNKSKVWIKENSLDFLKLGLWLLGAMGLFFTLSRGGWLALLLAGLIYLLTKANKKLLIFSFISAIVICGLVYSQPNWRYRVILPFLGQKSGLERISLWQAGKLMIANSPVVGQGLLGYFNNFPTYNTDSTITDNYPGPHNLFLHLWVDVGLLGLFVFVGLLIKKIVTLWAKKNDPIYLGVFLFLVAFLVHSQIDIAYFKNDLALMLWLIFSL